jgi:hypothetical protein
MLNSTRFNSGVTRRRVSVPDVYFHEADLKEKFHCKFKKRKEISIRKAHESGARPTESVDRA